MHKGWTVGPKPKPVPLKFCELCNCALQKSRGSSPSQFSKRRYCKTCARRATGAKRKIHWPDKKCEHCQKPMTPSKGMHRARWLKTMYHWECLRFVVGVARRTALVGQKKNCARCNTIINERDFRLPSQFVRAKKCRDCQAGRRELAGQRLSTQELADVAGCGFEAMRWRLRNMSVLDAVRRGRGGQGHPLTKAGSTPARSPKQRTAQAFGENPALTAAARSAG